MPKFYITTPIYYVNDVPHIGHAYTTIAADVLARYHRLTGDEVFFLTGTDEHGTKVAQSAEKAGRTPQEFCDINSAAFQMAWDRLDISNDYFIRTTSELHKNGVASFLNKLKDAGAIYESEYEGLYCVGCERFITEKELVDGKCPDHKIEPERLKEKNYFFNLKKYLPQVERLIDSGELKIMPKSRRKEVLGLFKQGLEDFSISRESVKWGIELPFTKSQVAYVWVEALMNYVTALGYGQDEEKFKKFWPAEIHLMAKDIIKFHAVYWPALLLAVGEKIPKVVFAHGFFTIDGEKMGKTLGNAIDPNALIDALGSDAVRYLLLSQFPFGQDGDIKAGNFAIQYNADLANGIGNLVSRVLAMAEKYFGGAVPETTNNDLKKDVEEIWAAYHKAMGEFAIDKAIEAIKKLNSVCDIYIENNRPWELAKTNEERLIEVMYNLLEAMRHLGLMLYPIIPMTAQKIMAGLGWSDFISQRLDDIAVWGRLEAGTKIAKPEALFPRLEK
ncbi:MAG: methionine--tRNA ligase [Patescibacteria group bacterium]